MGEIHLLPALPDAWQAGSITGLRARGGFTVDQKWKDGKLTSAVIYPDFDGTVRIRYGEKILNINTIAGKEVKINPKSFKSPPLPR